MAVGSVDVALGVLVVPVVVVSVDEGAVLVLVDDGPVGVVAPGVVVVDVVLVVVFAVVVAVGVAGAGVVLVDVGVAVVDALLELGGFATRPLSCSSVSICCWTAATSAAIALGVPSAPSAGSASSCSGPRSASPAARCDGAAVSVTTIWSAIAVVMQAGQLTFSAPATLIGAIVSLCRRSARPGTTRRRSCTPCSWRARRRCWCSSTGRRP